MAGYDLSTSVYTTDLYHAGLPLTISLLGHTFFILLCDVPRFTGNTVQVCATKQLKTGQEISNSYGE